MESRKSSSMLAPGFRFHPTDEELVRYYLRRKVCGKAFRFDAISEIDIYKLEPWDLPSFSKLKVRDLEWYFFSVLDKKYGNGARTNRATKKGYWKTTGKDRAVYHKSQIVGMKKTLVYHCGRAPKGQRSNWVMHEYRLADLELERAGIAQDAFVLCRVFQKSGSGPKNGEQYGAPFVEEEWEDDVLEVVPKEEATEEADDVFLDGHDLAQILGSDSPSYTLAPLRQHSEDGSCVEGTAESVNDYLYNSHLPYDTNGRAVKRDYIGESSKSEMFDCLDFLLDEPYLDSSYDVQNGNEGFIESNNPSNPIKSNASAFNMPAEYRMPFDATDGNAQQFAYDPSEMLQIDDVISREALLPLEELSDETEQSTLPQEEQYDDNKRNDDASTSASVPNELDSMKYESEFQYPFVKQSSRIFATSKDAALRLNSLSQPSSSVHVTAGMIQIRNFASSNGGDQSLDKLGNFKVVLSFGVSQNNEGSPILESSVGILLPGKTAMSTLSRGWLGFLFFMMIIVCVSFKMGTSLRGKNKF